MAALAAALSFVSLSISQDNVLAATANRSANSQNAKASVARRMKVHAVILNGIISEGRDVAANELYCPALSGYFEGRGYSNVSCDAEVLNIKACSVLRGKLPLLGTTLTASITGDLDHPLLEQDGIPIYMIESEHSSVMKIYLDLWKIKKTYFYLIDGSETESANSQKC